MKSFAYELTPEDQKRLFFWAWYHDPRLMLSRLLAGPACLVLAVLYIVFRSNAAYPAIGAIFILIGIYYLVQPLLVFRRGGRVGLKATLSIAGDEFRYEDEKVKTVVPRQLIESVRVRGNYLHIGVKTGKVAYFPFDLGRIAEREEFLDSLRGLVGSS